MKESAMLKKAVKEQIRIFNKYQKERLKKGSRKKKQ